MFLSLKPKIYLFILLLIITCLIILLGYYIYEHNRSPLNAIDGIDPHPRLFHQSSEEGLALDEKRFLADIRLLSETTDTIRALISFPINYVEQSPLPVIHILGGINIGRENLRFIKNPGQNIIVIFLYDYDMAEWESGSPFFEIPNIRNKILKTPAQIVELQSWLLRQSWTDTSRISLLGYSFGALFLPAAKNLAQKYNINTGPCILAYGGADFKWLIEKNLRIKPEILRKPLALLISTLIYTVDPLNHAPYLTGPFYLINGRRDRQIPEKSWLLLQQLIPGEKKIDVLDEGHMHPKKPHLTEKLIDMSREWLIAKGVLN